MHSIPKKRLKNLLETLQEETRVKRELINPLEKNKLGRFVTFNNLPPKVKISIFTVSGHLVRVLEKDGSDQFMRWDLLNRSGMPIASGIYLAYVDMPAIGETKILKVAIVLEAEILDNF